MRTPSIPGLVAAMLVALNFLGPAQPAHAADTSVTLTITPGTQKSTFDDAGAWGFLGGNVAFNNNVVGRWARILRTINGVTDLQSTAIVTLTIFLLGASPPDNLTLQGAHHFSSGNETGSISAASIAGAVGVRWTLQQIDQLTATLTFHTP